MAETIGHDPSSIRTLLESGERDRFPALSVETAFLQNVSGQGLQRHLAKSWVSAIWQAKCKESWFLREEATAFLTNGAPHHFPASGTEL